MAAVSWLGAGVGWVSGDYRGSSSDIAAGRRVTQQGRFAVFAGDRELVMPLRSMAIACFDQFYALPERHRADILLGYAAFSYVVAAN